MNMNNDAGSDDEFIEEELIVFADFQTKISADVFNEPNVFVKVLGMEDKNPIVQINDKLYQGTYDHPLGTHVFFEKNPDPPAHLEHFETVPKTSYRVFNKTDKILTMNRVFVTRKEDISEMNNVDNEMTEPITITKSYSMALNQFLKPNEEPPRSLDEEGDIFFRKYGTDNK